MCVDGGSPPKRTLERYAAYVLCVSVPPHTVDVALDPSKAAVHFAAWAGVAELVTTTVHDFLRDANLLPSEAPAPLAATLAAHDDLLPPWDVDAPEATGQPAEDTLSLADDVATPSSPSRFVSSTESDSADDERGTARDASHSTCACSGAPPGDGESASVAAAAAARAGPFKRSESAFARYRFAAAAAAVPPVPTPDADRARDSRGPAYATARRVPPPGPPLIRSEPVATHAAPAAAGGGPAAPVASLLQVCANA